jgi:hypothetical protein
VPCDWEKKPKRQTLIGGEARHQDGRSNCASQCIRNANSNFRDQELRFTVRDAPDYYKLKVSVFNDDKKTDLIGESWIDLSDLIVPGGKANDLWHQLNYKGKYAGDIRLEMTYYDTKPNPEIEATKERQRQKATSTANDTSSLSGPRQLGPREIKRRPLPTGPGLAQAQPADFPQPLRLQSRQSQTPPNQPAYVHPHYVPQPQQYVGPEGPDDYEQYCSPTPYEDAYTTRDHPQNFEQQHAGYDEYTQSLPPIPMEHPRPPPLEAHHSDPGPFTSSSPYGSPHYNSSPPARPMNNDPRAHRMSSSPTKYAAYRDSPLRQSMAPHDVPSLPPIPPKIPMEYADEPSSPPPPPPPAHRDSMPRPLALTYGTPPRVPPQQPQHREMIDDRSPLQMIEHNYSPHPRPSHGPPPRTHRKSFNEPPPVERPTSSAGDFPAPHQVNPNYGVDFMAEPVEQDNAGRYIRRNSFIEDHDDPYRAPQRAQTFDSPGIDDRNTYRSEPQLVRPRAVSPNVAHHVPRKSVSPAPPIDDSEVRGTPFGPDCYNVLNPASSPASGMGRQGSGMPEKPEDIEPIIGNDGRIIDPSDHLPAETWAPEPERKNRQPEHVIRIRTRADAQQARAGSSPVAVRTPPAQAASYNSSPAPMSEPALSPTSERRRNRLQKPMPGTRPLPAQPYQHANTSPASIPQTRSFENSGPVQHPRPPSSHSQGTLHRSPQPSSPHSTGPPRPPLTDYQVPVSNRHSYYNITPTKVQMPRPQSYAPPSVHDDPLAAELSMIDIGPSRSSGRTMARGRGYGGY